MNMIVYKTDKARKGNKSWKQKHGALKLTIVLILERK